MTLAVISHPDCLLHTMGNMHPECPERVEVIMQALQKSALQSQLHFYEAPLATREQLNLAHSAEYVEEIFNIAPEVGFLPLDPDTGMNPHTLTAALRAAGAAIFAVDLVLTNKHSVVFCNVRPPGHHAMHAQAMGFCFFNNIAVGVAHALAHYGIQRIAIVDFDVHHGNGTEDIFQDEKRVLLCSSFQHPFYPNSGADTMSEHILNVPLPAGTSGAHFRIEVADQWFARLDDFKPELIFFSAGFDAHAHDDMANLFLREEDYAWLSASVRDIARRHAQGRMISLLEGGYALPVLGQSVVAHLENLV